LPRAAQKNKACENKSLAQFPAVQSPVTQTCRGPSDLMWKKLALKGEKQLGFWSQLPPGVCPRSGFVELDVFQRKRFPQIKDFLGKYCYVGKAQ
jgi:hypothetical protein